jgi:hypothetical protein
MRLTIYERLMRPVATNQSNGQVRATFLQVADLRSGHQHAGEPPALRRVATRTKGIMNTPNYLRKLPKVLAYGHQTQKPLASAFRRVMLWLN